MNNVHDVVIIGAGPGGSSAAYFLAHQGMDVLLLDKSEFECPHTIAAIPSTFLATFISVIRPECERAIITSTEASFSSETAFFKLSIMERNLTMQIITAKHG